jgi:hypothetical protein
MNYINLTVSGSMALIFFNHSTGSDFSGKISPAFYFDIISPKISVFTFYNNTIFG